MATSMCKFCLGRLSGFPIVLRQTKRITSNSSFASYSTQSSSTDDVEVVIVPEPEVDESIINKLRDVSGLKGNLYLRNHNKKPKLLTEYQRRIKYRRRLYGKFGSSANFDPRKCWPSRDELREEKEFDKEWEPTLQQMMENIKMKRKAHADLMAKREATVTKNMEKMSEWIEEYREKQVKASEAKRMQEEKRARLLQEAEEYFGYKVDPRDVKFKEVMEKKVKEEKKLAKQQKKQEKDAKFKAKLQALADETQES